MTLFLGTWLCMDYFVYKVNNDIFKDFFIPFLVPQSTDKLANLLGGHSIEEQDTIIHRIRKSNHASLAEGNKEKLWVRTFDGLGCNYHIHLPTIVACFSFPHLV